LQNKTYSLKMLGYAACGSAASGPAARNLRGIRDFVQEQKARLGIVINTDTGPRLYDDNILGLPFHWL
jgi:hypothetical protein